MKLRKVDQQRVTNTVFFGQVKQMVGRLKERWEPTKGGKKAGASGGLHVTMELGSCGGQCGASQAKRGSIQRANHVRCEVISGGFTGANEQRRQGCHTMGLLVLRGEVHDAIASWQRKRKSKNTPA